MGLLADHHAECAEQLDEISPSVVVVGDARVLLVLFLADGDYAAYD